MMYLADQKRNWALLFMLIVMLTTSCSSVPKPVHKSLEASLCNKSFDITVLSNIPKEEISVPVKRYSAPDRYIIFGLSDILIQALEDVLIYEPINKARASATEKTLAPLLKVTADVDFRTQYWSNLEPLISGSPWLKVTSLDKRTFGYKKEEADKINAPILMLTTVYQLSPNFQTLLVQTMARLYLLDTSTTDYFGFMSYYSGKIGKNNEEDEKAVELWMADNAAAYRKALAEGIEQNMKMLRLDLINGPANPLNENGEELKLTFLSPVSDSSETLQGKVLDRNGSRIILRDVRGNLFSVDTTSQE